MDIYNKGRKKIILNQRDELITPNNLDFFISIYNFDKKLLEKLKNPICFNNEINIRYRFLFKTNKKNTFSFLAYTFNDEIIFLSNVNNLEKYIINGEKLKHDYIKWEINTFDLPENFELIISDSDCNEDLEEVTYFITDNSHLSFKTYNNDSKYFFYHLE